ncbi:histone-lysine N-methyltransferase 2D-like isoform X2 [Cynoglossus semilaevis]|uniref:histone-lysine N-methyltransferase 2D-like isoform X2 n=1 Tax=Cynoglossus semilaevis TaxID=244447 RepID=UPI000D62F925|nr:histone-lysine N-methyltransferase 2D-like isoform X2 [Cynoglossus semilaevis]
MAYRGRFSFWDHKVKVDNKPVADADSGKPQTVAKQEPITGSGAQPTASTAETPSSSYAMGGPDGEQSSSGKKVVRVVRRVVRRVAPDPTEEQSQPTVQESATSSFKTTKAAARDDKDDISMGLTSLMGRSRTKEHRLRSRTQDRKEDLKEEGKNQDEENAKVDEVEKKPEEDKPVEDSSKSAPSPTAKMNSPTPQVGFIPPPKPDPLAPPAGFIPAPRQNPLTPLSAAKKHSPGPPKQNTLPRPPGFIPIPKSDPLAPPAGFIPKPRTVAVKKPEVFCVVPNPRVEQAE